VHDFLLIVGWVIELRYHGPACSGNVVAMVCGGCCRWRLMAAEADPTAGRVVLFDVTNRG